MYSRSAVQSAERSFLDALESFEEAIQRANWPSALVDQLMGEIDAIYAELSKPHPSLHPATSQQALPTRAKEQAECLIELLQIHALVRTARVLVFVPCSGRILVQLCEGKSMQNGPRGLGLVYSKACRAGRCSG